MGGVGKLILGPCRMGACGEAKEAEYKESFHAGLFPGSASGLSLSDSHERSRRGHVLPITRRSSCRTAESVRSRAVRASDKLANLVRSQQVDLCLGPRPGPRRDA